MIRRDQIPVCSDATTAFVRNRVKRDSQPPCIRSDAGADEAMDPHTRRTDNIPIGVGKITQPCVVDHTRRDELLRTTGFVERQSTDHALVAERTRNPDAR